MIVFVFVFLFVFVFVFVFVPVWCSIVFVLVRSGQRPSKFVLLLREESNQTSANLSSAHKPEICNDDEKILSKMLAKKGWNKGADLYNDNTDNLSYIEINGKKYCLGSQDSNNLGWPIQCGDYKCNHCGKTFASVGNKYAHIRQAHLGKKRNYNNRKSAIKLEK